jgi:hypothetical protein
LGSKFNLRLSIIFFSNHTLYFRLPHTFIFIAGAKRRKCSKRKSSGNPRVPFSTSQLMTLENKYLETRYLSGSDVTDLSATLALSEHRVKIWFQNRRAREKKSHISWNRNDERISFANPVILDGERCFMPGWFGTI